MPRYLTPQGYRYSYDGMVDGPPGNAIKDMQLAALITRAEAAIDAYIGFDGRYGGLEPHVVYNFQQGFDFEARRARIPLYPAPARNIKRFNIHISNAGGGQAAPADAIIQPDDIALNNTEGYFEAIPLQAITYSLSAVVWGLGLEPPIAEIDYESGFYLPYWGDTLYDTGDQLTYRAVRGFWAATYTQTGTNQPSTLPPTPAVIYKNGAPVSAGVTVNYTEGSVTFSAENATTDVITSDYTAQIPDVIAAACVDQVTWLLQQRALSQMGMGGLMEVNNGDQRLMRYRAENVKEDLLCAKARERLRTAGYKPTPLGGA